MKENKTLKRFITKVRGLRVGDYVQFWWDAVKQGGHGEIECIVQLKENLGLGYVIRVKKDWNRILIIPKLGDEIFLETRKRRKR